MSLAHSLGRTLLIAVAAVGLTAGGLALAPSSPTVPAVHADVRTPAPIAFADSGADLFAQNCVACHGAKGDGDGPAAPGLTPKPRKLSDKAIMSKISDDQILKILKAGGAATGKSPLMPPHGDLSSKPELLAAMREVVRGFGR